MIANYLTVYLNEHNTLYDAQLGFRRVVSTARLTAIVHDFAKVLDKSGQIDAIFLDYSKECIKIPHNKLFLKLKLIRIHPKIMRWIQAYSESRRQLVDVDKSYFSLFEIKF